MGEKTIRYPRVCLETQWYPDAINQQFLPNNIIKAGEEYIATVSTSSAKYDYFRINQEANYLASFYYLEITWTILIDCCKIILVVMS